MVCLKYQPSSGALYEVAPTNFPLLQSFGFAAYFWIAPECFLAPISSRPPLV